MNIIQPGIVDGEPAREILGLSADTDAVTAKVEGKSAGDVVGIFLRMIPTNVVHAAAQGQMLGIIFFGLLFGVFMTQIKQEHSRVLQSFWQGVFDVMMLITDLVMKFAPIGVFALVAKVVMISGLEAFKPLLVFFFTVLIALLIHIVVVMPLLLRLVARVSPVRHYQAMAPALLTAFSTASSLRDPFRSRSTVSKIVQGSRTVLPVLSCRWVRPSTWTVRPCTNAWRQSLSRRPTDST